MGKAVASKPARKSNPRFIPGQEGIVRFGHESNVRVVVVEDRGTIGPAGPHIVFVRTNNPDDDTATTFEVYAENLVLNKPAT